MADALPVRAPLSLAVIGCGPGGTSLLERLCANAPDLLGDRELHVHVVDPHPPGAGRIWRREQSALMWTNSFASEITVFTDETSTCAGPVNPGPSLWEWGRDRAAEAREGRLSPELAPFAEELARLTPRWFASRPLLSAYLAWAFGRTVAAAPPSVRIIVHRTRAVDVADLPGAGYRQRVELADGTRLAVDAVVLSQGHVDVGPEPEERRLSAHAAAHGLAFVPCDNEPDTSDLRPGAEVIARGMGLAFVDLMVRVSSGRGGQFVRDGNGLLHYRASGREPVLLAASRRGVPYRAKIGYRLDAGHRAPAPRFLTAETLRRLPNRSAAGWDLARDIMPLVILDMAWAHYHRLCTAHRDRTTADWAAFSAEFAGLADDFIARAGRGPAAGPPTCAAQPLVARTVPDPADRFDPDLLDRPLAGRRFPDAAALDDAVRAHIAADIARRADARFSADLAAQQALGAAYSTIGRLAAAGELSERSRREDLPGFHGFFSYLSSGPPRVRLEELSALSRAGLVRFLGEDVAVTADEDGFTAYGPSLAAPVRTRALIESRLPLPSPSRAVDPLLRALYARGEVADELLAGRPSGRVRTLPGEQRLVAANGTAHPARFAVGPGVAGGVTVQGFAKPGYDAQVFLVHDALARAVLAALARCGGANTDAVRVAV
ncbi:FAD/NAD(P)-binding protein [Yinghuangia sp. YIM S09857]|uniref:FAD/NAD(P)-binding protein n=1 Tax=Yinghuangia sp. YIM S09857 TaxID=3436929 RepID=UPI003F52C908